MRSRSGDWHLASKTSGDLIERRSIMHDFAPKPSATQHVVPAVTAIPDRAHPGRSRETSAIPDLQRDAASRIGYDFSRTPAHPPAASIQRKRLISTPGDRYEREADDLAD